MMMEFMQASGATLFNLSLLTADMWAVVIRVFVYHQKVFFMNAQMRLLITHFLFRWL